MEASLSCVYVVIAALSECYRANAEAIDGELKERLHLMGITERSRPDVCQAGRPFRHLAQIIGILRRTSIRRSAYSPLPKRKPRSGRAGFFWAKRRGVWTGTGASMLGRVGAGKVQSNSAA